MGPNFDDYHGFQHLRKDMQHSVHVETNIKVQKQATVIAQCQLAILKVTYQTSKGQYDFIKSLVPLCHTKAKQMKSISTPRGPF